MWKFSLVFLDWVSMGSREKLLLTFINSVPSKSKIEVTLISVVYFSQFTIVHKCSRPLFETHCGHHGQIRNFETQNGYCLRAIRNSTKTDANAQWLLLVIFVQKVFATNLNFRYQTSKKFEKVKPFLLKCQF